MTARSARSAHGKAAKPPEPLRLDCEGQPLPPLQKTYKSVPVPRALTSPEQHTLAAVTQWIKLGRSASAAFPLSALVGDAGGWVPPNIRLGFNSGRRLSWWKLCCLHAAAAHRNQLADLHALLLHIEGEETDDLSLARGLELARQLIAATQGRERKFVKRHRLDQPQAEEEIEPQQETG